MGRRKNKFEKLGVNENYGKAAPTEEKKSLSETIKEHFMPGFEPEPDSERTSKRFAFKKVQRPANTFVSDDKPKAVLEKGFIPSHILMLVVTALSYGALAVSSDKTLSGLSEMNKYIFYILICVIVYIVPSVVYCVIRKLPPKRVYVRGFSPSVAALSFVSLLLLVTLTMLEKYYIAYNFSYRVSESVPYGASVFGTLLTSAILPAVFETLFVNGVLQSEYSRFGGGVTGIVASSLVFAFLHFDVRMFFIYFTAGLVLSVLTHASRSCIPAMIVHFINNAAAIFLADSMTFIASERIGGTFLMTVLSILFFLFLLIQLQMLEKISLSRYAKVQKSINDAKELGREPKYKDFDIHFVSGDGLTAKRFFRLLFSPALILAAIVFVVCNF